ncbi:hypothetical protein OQA88_5966 [Cercophora sp. LCS_1]
MSATDNFPQAPEAGPSTSSPSTSSGNNLSEADRRFLEAAMTCLKAAPEIDTAKLAEKLNIKPKTVMNRWAELKKKLYSNDPPSTPRKRKNEDGDSGPPKKTPKTPKTPRFTKKKGPVVPVYAEADDAGEV